MMQRSGTFDFTRLRAQFIKEALSILRDPRSRMVVFVPPLLQLLVFAFAATLEVRNVDIAVHDQDAGRWSTSPWTSRVRSLPAGVARYRCSSMVGAATQARSRSAICRALPPMSAPKSAAMPCRRRRWWWCATGSIPT